MGQAAVRAVEAALFDDRPKDHSDRNGDAAPDGEAAATASGAVARRVPSAPPSSRSTCAGLRSLGPRLSPTTPRLPGPGCD